MLYFYIFHDIWNNYSQKKRKVAQRQNIGPTSFPSWMSRFVLFSFVRGTVSSTGCFVSLMITITASRIWRWSSWSGCSGCPTAYVWQNGGNSTSTRLRRTRNKFRCCTKCRGVAWHWKIIFYQHRTWNQNQYISMQFVMIWKEIKRLKWMQFTYGFFIPNTIERKTIFSFKSYERLRALNLGMGWMLIYEIMWKWIKYLPLTLTITVSANITSISFI